MGISRSLNEELTDVNDELVNANHGIPDVNLGLYIVLLFLLARIMSTWVTITQAHLKTLGNQQVLLNVESNHVVMMNNNNQ
jgi:hypothetical protein